MILGLGHDVVDVEAFAGQLAQPGSRMRELFSVRERRQCALRAKAKGDGEAVHLAARWAAKEAVVKAWCEALAFRTSGSVDASCPSGDIHSGTHPGALPYTVETTPWALIETIDGAHGVPRVVLAPEVMQTLVDSLREATGNPSIAPDTLAWHVPDPRRPHRLRRGGAGIQITGVRRRNVHVFPASLRRAIFGVARWTGEKGLCTMAHAAEIT
ncbi:MAG: 4'-phosphopantetheinyl transferase superfamily protein [Bifidobacterium sp.]|nr:4'-phosphopantetheinyl transferase superfamily protein [Bifidobacterium sp.]